MAIALWLESGARIRRSNPALESGARIRRSNPALESGEGALTVRHFFAVREGLSTSLASFDAAGLAAEILPARARGRG
jgi:hypothetical protein